MVSWNDVKSAFDDLSDAVDRAIASHKVQDQAKSDLLAAQKARDEADQTAADTLQEVSDAEKRLTDVFTAFGNVAATIQLDEAAIQKATADLKAHQQQLQAAIDKAQNPHEQEKTYGSSKH